MVLPYLGGPTVASPSRPLRVTSPGAAGWYAFEVEGRKATIVEEAAPLDLSDRPKVRGHWSGGWLFVNGAKALRLHLVPQMEPEPLAIVVGRRWVDGELLYAELDFESEAEMSARLRLEENAPLGALKGVTPSLRFAYGFALLCRVARRLNVPVSLTEVHAASIRAAEEGTEAAEEALQHLIHERLLRQRARAAAQAIAVAEGRRAQWRRQRGDLAPDILAERALEAVQATLLSTRRLDESRMEVVFRFMGERFVSVVDQASLHVYDAGICLSGHDEELTLDSLPAVVREAIEDDLLVITRH